MLLNTLITEKYKKNHKCQTPGAVYDTEVHSRSIKIEVNLPKGVVIPDDSAADLETKLHYAIEKVLSDFFPG